MDVEKLKKIEGLRTIEEISDVLKISRQSALNLISKLKKQGYATVSGGRQQKRIYKLTRYKQAKTRGMFDIINEHSKLKVYPLFRHIVHGEYTEENALIDAILLKNRRTLLAALPLFNHIRNWKKLGELAEKYDLNVQVGCMYNLARTAIKTRKIPEKTYKKLKRGLTIETVWLTTEKTGKISKEWNCQIPFSEEDLKRLKE